MVESEQRSGKCMSVWGKLQATLEETFCLVEAEKQKHKVLS